MSTRNRRPERQTSTYRDRHDEELRIVNDLLRHRRIDLLAATGVLEAFKRVELSDHDEHTK